MVQEKRFVYASLPRPKYTRADGLFSMAYGLYIMASGRCCMVYIALHLSYVPCSKPYISLIGLGPLGHGTWPTEYTFVLSYAIVYGSMCVEKL